MRGSKDTWTEDGPAGGPQATPPAADRYEETGRILGQGGLGRVDLVVDPRLGREVARKRLLRDSPAQRARFLREARVTARLEHAGIVPIYEVGADPDGVPYYTMRRIPGRTLGEAVAAAAGLRGRLELLPHLVDACQAVGYAHAHGVVHRDLKPDNVMIGPYGETFVVDWGLARDATGDDGGGVAGSPAYMSPEQARGEPADPRSDVWGLGAMLFEVLTGRPPFDGVDGTTAVERLRAGALGDLAAALAGVPPELAAIALRALRIRPEERYPSAGALAADVAAWQTGARVGAYGYSWWELLRQLVRKNPALTAVLALSTLGLLGFGARLYAERRDADLRYAQALVALARNDADGGRAEEALARLAEAGTVLRRHGADDAPVVLGTAWARRSAPPPLFEFPAALGVGAVAISLTGHLAAARDGERVRAWDLALGREVASAPLPGGRGGPHLDGDHLYVQQHGGGTVRLIDAVDLRERMVRPGGLGETLLPRGADTWVGDARGVWLRGPDGSERAVTLGARVLLGADAAGEVALVAFGRLGELPSRIALLDREGVELNALPGATAAALAPDGAFAAALVEGRVVVARRDGTRAELPVADGARGAFALAGGRVAITDVAGDLEVRSLDGGLVWRVAGVGRDVAGVTADGRFALVQRPRTIEVRAAAPPERVPPPLGADDLADAAASDDGQVAWTAGLDGFVRAVDLPTGRVLAAWEVDPKGVRGVVPCDGGATIGVAGRSGAVSSRAPDGAVRWSFQGDGIATAARCRPEGGLVGAWADGTVRELDADGRVVRELATGTLPWTVRVVGDRLLVSDRSGLGPAWRLLDRASGAVVAAAADVGPAYGAAVAPGDAWALVGTHAGGVRRVELSTGREEVWTVSATALSVAIEPATGWSLVGAIDGTTTVFSADGSRLGVFPLGGSAQVAARDTLAFRGPSGGWETFRFGEAELADRAAGFAAAGWWSEAVAALPPELQGWPRLRLLALAGRAAEARAVLAAMPEVSPPTRALWESSLGPPTAP